MIEAQTYWLNSPFKLDLKKESINSNELLDNQILCETLSSAISSGTELSAYTGMKPLRPGKVYPRLLGYCNVGRVLFCGQNVTLVKPGDRVLTFLSHRSHYIVSEDEILSLVPNDISSDHAACSYLYHLGYDAVLKSKISYGSPVVVIGLGALGLGAVAMASNAGAVVYAVSDHSHPAEVAKKYGALNVYKRNDISSLVAELGPRLADSVISTTNSWEDWLTALKIAGMRSAVSVIGFPGRDSKNIPFNPLDSQYFYDKQLCLKAVGMAAESLDSRCFLKFNEKNNLKFILSQMSNERLLPDLIISKVWKWTELKGAYENLLSRKESPITYILKWKN